MKNFLLATLLLLLTSLLGVGQSGRKVAAKPTPSPAAKEDDTPAFSESKPKPSRANRMVERFPRIGDGSEIKAPAADASATDTNSTKDDGDVLRIETSLITIPVSVFDRNGLYIPGLHQQDFKIYEDGVEQEIAYFGTTDKPFTVVLLLDTSPSTQYKIEEIHQAAIAFVDQLEPQDSVIVIEFNSSVKVQTELTRDRDKIYKGINRAKFGNGTSLYNAVDEALRKQLGKISGRKAVVLFTDGVDTTSKKNTYDGTLDYAEESDALIFPIYFNTYLQNRPISSPFPDILGPGGPIPGQGRSAQEYAVGKKYLEELADVTGGRVFRPESTPGGLTAAFEGIAEELRRQYNIGYIPKNEGKVGQRKQIKVRVNRANLIIRSRDSYIVGTVSPAAPADSVKPTK